ncbi:MAG: M48 family metallopeptidase [Nanoarchaeota archaeon]|nr:M48 family metallopeptidase [Nanoarchaeota archaeon]MBU0977402.1 M48 family metallopeptidase [Nanoarchaeota archaeon]
MVEHISFHDEIRRNKLKSFFLIVVIFVFFIILGALISLALDPGYFFVIMIIATIFSLCYVLISYYNSDKIALASVRAKPASRTEDRMFFHAAESMSLASGLPMPKLYVMESEQINAFASGRDPQNAVICVTTGALKKLNKQELEGVIAHEMSHVANYDMRFMTTVAVVVGLISIIAQIFLRSLWFSGGQGGSDNKKGGAVLLILAIVFAILAPLVANLVSLAISRKREFGADATAVKFTRYPPGLKNALVKIRDESIPERDKKRYSKAMAPLFMSDPYKKKISGLFATHPPIELRIEKLERM